VDTEQTARHIREVEAESVALICCETLGLYGADFCRGYIQHWLKSEKEIPNQSTARIFAAATAILKAGTSAPENNQMKQNHLSTRGPARGPPEYRRGFVPRFFSSTEYVPF
jgi:hypothetical protein